MNLNSGSYGRVGPVHRRDLLKGAAQVGAGVAGLSILSALQAQEPSTNKEDRDPSAQSLKGLGYVVVTPEGPKDGGHFGKHTPGTKTAGIQEAINHAKVNRRDVYIAGGAMPGQFRAGACYVLQEPLRIPWMQDFRLDGGEYALNYSKPTGYAIVIDSQMNCRYKFGKVLSASKDGGVVWFRPQTRGPDNFSVITASVFEFGVVLGAGGARPGEGVRGIGNGILLDSSAGGIHVNRIFAMEVVGCDRGLYLKGHRVHNNEMQVIFSHINNIHLRIGDTGALPSHNRITMDMIDSRRIPGSIGADIFGHRNLLTLNVVQTAPGNNIVFEPDAKDNLVVGVNLPDGITNRARMPTNRIISCRPVGFGITTQAFPASGQDAVNAHPYPVEILYLSAGTVSDWTVTDAGGTAQTVSAGLSAGQTLVLQPGEKIKFTYAAAPTWKWKALG